MLTEKDLQELIKAGKIKTSDIDVDFEEEQDNLQKQKQQLEQQKIELQKQKLELEKLKLQKRQKQEDDTIKKSKILGFSSFLFVFMIFSYIIAVIVVFFMQKH